MSQSIILFHLKKSIINQLEKQFSKESGFVSYWDNVAKAPYLYHAAKKEFATFDNEQSLHEKVAYMKKHQLGGIMFWELILDKNQNGMVDAIDKVKQVN